MANDAMTDQARPVSVERLQAAIAAVCTNEVVRAIAALRAERTVCREQDGKPTFVSGTDAAREYLRETLLAALPPEGETPQSSPGINTVVDVYEAPDVERPTAEQQARDLLQRLGVSGAQDFSSGDLVELANLIASERRSRAKG